MDIARYMLLTSILFSFVLSFYVFSSLLKLTSKGETTILIILGLIASGIITAFFALFFITLIYKAYKR